ncbi:MAG: xanthine dehydrogenase family protein molybdopterin-binding subunit, partial [Acidimicrobiia bacterium]|nr:xanthine dehydrogenase family protein molybdopterin-binding subunit [Acidimicrobiia bacterium]
MDTHTASWPSPIGVSVLRHEDPPLLRGEACYVADVNLPGHLTLAFVRSSISHGVILGIDSSAASALPGVEAIFTAQDLSASLGKVPRIPPRVSFDETVVPYLQPVLAVDRVR